MPNKKRARIKDLLSIQGGRAILSSLQAGRIQNGNMNRPYRLSDEELEILQDEWIEWWDDGDRYFASFEKDTNEIRAMLNLPPQHNNWLF